MIFGDLVKSFANIINGKDVEIFSITRDSRSVCKGSCFLACKGLKYNGNRFVEEAISKGAVAIISDEKINISNKIAYAYTKDSMKTWGEISSVWFDNPSKKIQIVGITGTNGKTTSTYLLEKVFETAGLKTGVIGTIEYRYDNIKKEASRTTPDAYDLQELFSNMNHKAVKAVAMEVSSHAIDQKRIAGTTFAGAIFTNLTPEHLDYHVSMENYFESKAKLFREYLSHNDSFAVINNDDKYGKMLTRDLNVKNVWTCGFSSDSRIRAENLIINSDGMTFDVDFGKEVFSIESSLLGKFNCYNILGVIGSAIALGINIEDVKSGIKRVKNIPGRAELVKNDRGVLALVDYAHTPDALENILTQMRNLTNKKLIVVFGCGGDRDKLKRSAMGEVSARLADIVIVTDDNPRTEKPETIREEIFSGVEKIDSSKGIIVSNRRDAIFEAVKLAKEGDVVLLAGKGHENYQEIDNVRLHFDDKEVLSEAFND